MKDPDANDTPRNEAARILREKFDEAIYPTRQRERAMNDVADNFVTERSPRDHLNAAAGHECTEPTQRREFKIRQWPRLRGSASMA